MAFNLALMKESSEDPFSKHNGSCTWSEWFLLSDAAGKTAYGLRRQVVSTETNLDGEMVKVLAYLKGKDSDTALIVDSSRSDLPGMFCHFHNGYSGLEPVRYFYGDVYFESAHLFDLLKKVGIATMPDKPGLAVPILHTIMKALEVEVSRSFSDNVAGMADWVRNNHQKYTYAPWPITS